MPVKTGPSFIEDSDVCEPSLSIEGQMIKGLSVIDLNSGANCPAVFPSQTRFIDKVPMSYEFEVGFASQDALDLVMLRLCHSRLCVNSADNFVLLTDPSIGSSAVYDIGLERVANTSAAMEILFKSLQLYKVLKHAFAGLHPTIIDDAEQSVSLEEIFGSRCKDDVLVSNGESGKIALGGVLVSQLLLVFKLNMICP